MPNVMNIDVLPVEVEIFCLHLAKVKKVFVTSQGEFGGHVARCGPNTSASRARTSMFITFGMDLGTLEPKIIFGQVS